MKATIRVEIGKQPGEEFELVLEPGQDEKAMIGRDPLCAVRLHDNEVSRRHSEIWVEEGQFFIRDLGSRNGTRVNGHKVKKRKELNDGDTIDVGLHRMVFCLPRERPKRPEPVEEPEDDGQPKRTGSVRKPLSTALTRDSILQHEAMGQPTDPHIGSVFAGSYKITEQVHKSDKSIVYRAQETGSGQEVAIKLVRPGVAFDDAEKARFVRGAKKAVGLRSRNVARILRGGQQHGLFYIVMQFVDGQSLATALEENPYGLELDTCVNMGLQLANVLGAMFTLRMVHRHICPDNVLIGKDGVLKLTDFDLLKSYEPGRDVGEDVTSESSESIGTDLLYAAPELLTRPAQADFRADMYSVGAVLYHTATGVPALGDVAEGELLTRVLKGEVLGPEKLKPSIPADLSVAIMTAMQPSPEDRYESPELFAEDLRKAKAAIAAL